MMYCYDGGKCVKVTGMVYTGVVGRHMEKGVVTLKQTIVD